MDFQTLKDNFEKSIRTGEILEVKAALEKINVATVPRKLVADYADIARRVRADRWGLRVLRPIVRPETPIHPEATEQEKCAYAGLLIKVGAFAEAEKLLQDLSESANPQVLTFKSQVHILQWNYPAAEKVLRKSIRQKELNPYSRCIAKVNLAAAFLFLEKFEEAQILLTEILKECEENHWELLQGNALELLAQIAVLRAEWDKADQYLHKSELRAGQHANYLIFVEKWRLLSRLLRAEPGTGESDLALHQIEELKTKAWKHNSWETLRDLDYHVGLRLKHENLLLHVYFGTPFPLYRKRIESFFKAKNWKIAPVYFRKLNDSPATRVLDLETGTELEAALPVPLKPGKMLHRLLNILAMDFYKPMTAGELFSKLFPDEYFNPDSTPERVSQAVKKLRQWFRQNNIPVDVQVQNTKYWLEARGAYAFKMEQSKQNLKDLSDSGWTVKMGELKSKWPYQNFSAGEAAAELKISESSARTLLKTLKAEGKVLSSGQGRATRYYFKT